MVSISMIFLSEPASFLALLVDNSSGFELRHLLLLACPRSHSFGVSFVSLSPVFQKRKRFMAPSNVFGNKVFISGIPSGKSAVQMREG